MTREEAIIDLNALKFILDNDQYTDEIEEALDTAIFALQQPEIVRCKDCRWKEGSECVRFSDVRPFPDDFCSRAERKEGEADG